MIEAFRYTAEPGERAADFSASLKDLLVDGGDGRLALDPFTGRNRYGCCPYPDAQLADFGSSTASIISQGAFEAAEALRSRLCEAEPRGPSGAAYARELQRIR
jgi:hypothetical protein